MSFPSDGFLKASFDGHDFAYSEVSMKGGIRYAIHEYPHTAGGEPEKMGRKPYVITFHAHFNDMPGTDLEREYPDAYPTAMRILREKFEVQLTADLIVPSVGKIRACATDWVQKYDVRLPTGETFDLEFLEDSQSVYLLSGVNGQTKGAASVTEAYSAAFAAAARADFNKPDTQSFFQSLNDAITLVQGAVDQGDAYSRVLEGKLQGVVNLIAQADRNLEELQNPVNHLVIDALKDLQLATMEFAENITESSQRLLVYTTPRMMTIGQVSAVLYGTSEKGAEILQLNAVDDAFAIPPSTPLKYLSAA